MTGRREQRAELEATWMVYDATRPIRKADLEGDATAPTDAAKAAAPEAADMLHGGTTQVPR